MKWLVFLLLLPISASAAGNYQLRQLSEREVVQTYIQILRDACRYADGNWTNGAFDPAAGYWGDGASSGNQGNGNQWKSGTHLNI